MVTSETYSIECFILRLKHIHDQLHAIRVKIYDDDFTIAVLNGLPSEYDMILTVLIARESSLSHKDFRPHLLVAETIVEARIVHHTTLYGSTWFFSCGSSFW